jgi:TrmH family RNA methyltransferase
MEPRITSTKNPLVKRIKALTVRDAREEEGRFVVEGIRMVEELFSSGLRVELLMYDPTLTGDRAQELLDRARAAGVQLIPASRNVIEAGSTVEAPQGVIAVAELPRPTSDGLLERPDLLLVVADRIQDPGNLGTIIRIADAAGVTGVVVTSGSVDPYNSKALRATMGSLFHLPVVQLDVERAQARLGAAGVRVLVADQTGAVDYTEADYHPPVAIVLGNEGQGPDDRWQQAAGARIRIPLYGRAESLNVAVAAGLLLYEARRARYTFSQR